MKEKARTVPLNLGWMKIL